MWKREDVIWAAGLLEGEGTFVEKSSQPGYLEIQCNSTDKDVLDRLKQVFNLGKVYGPYKFASDKLGKKEKWTWKVNSSHQVLAIIFAIFPWMSVRRQFRMTELVKLYREPKYFRSYLPDGSYNLVT